MDRIVGFLFERPIALGVTCGLVCLVLLVLWRRTQTDGRRQAFLIGVAASVALLLGQAVVDTDREKIIRLIGELADAVERQDFDRLERGLADRVDPVDGPIVPREELVALGRSRTSRGGVDNIHLFNFKVTLHGDSAVATFQVYCDVQRSDTPINYVPSVWELELIERDGEWRVGKIRPKSVFSQSVRGLHDLMGM